MSRTSEIKKLVVKLATLRRSLERIDKSSAPEHAKYVSVPHFAAHYNKIVPGFNELFPEDALGMYDLERIGSWADTVWPQQKNLFDQIFNYINMMEAIATDEVSSDVAIQSVLADFIEANLRKAIHDLPKEEITVQNALENLFIGRGMRRGTDYLREAGKVVFSGKEFIPDFVIVETGTAVEVKLLKEIKRRSSVVEEMSADVPAYLSGYRSVLFVVYDTAGIRDVDELKDGLQASGDVVVLLVKH